MEKVSSGIALRLGFCYTKLPYLGKEIEIAKRVEVVEHGVCTGQEGSEDRKGCQSECRGIKNQSTLNLKDRCGIKNARAGPIGSGT